MLLLQQVKTVNEFDQKIPCACILYDRMCDTINFILVAIIKDSQLLYVYLNPPTFH